MQGRILLIILQQAGASRSLNSEATALTSLFDAMSSLTLILSFYLVALQIVGTISTGGLRRFVVRSK